MLPRAEDLCDVYSLRTLLRKSRLVACSSNPLGCAIPVQKRAPARLSSQTERRYCTHCGDQFCFRNFRVKDACNRFHIRKSLGSAAALVIISRKWPLQDLEPV